MEKLQKKLSIKRVRLKILAQKEKGILHGQRGQKSGKSMGFAHPPQTVYVRGLHADQFGNNWKKKFPGQPKLDEAVGRV